MTIREKIECMEAFERGEGIEYTPLMEEIWRGTTIPAWDWALYEYRIKPKPKQVVVIEKWLAESAFDGHLIIEGTKEYIQDFSNTKVKLLDTYEVEL